MIVTMIFSMLFYCWIKKFSLPSWNESQISKVLYFIKMFAKCKTKFKYERLSVSPCTSFEFLINAQIFCINKMAKSIVVIINHRRHNYYT